MPKRKISGVNYASSVTPADYKCDGCGATGCKLWREYQTFADYTKLLCADCAAKDEHEDISDIDADGRHNGNFYRTDQIGWYIPAVPVEGENTYWGYTSIPQAGCDWWGRLPTKPQKSKK
jgi:hypothetical protein